MKAKLWLLVALVTSFVLIVVTPARSPANDDFYKGKTIRFVVGLAPGGATISRLAPSGGTLASIFPAIPPSWLKT